MAIVIALPILGLLTIFQSAIISRFPLLHGTADLVLLTVIAWSLQKKVRTGWHWGIMGGLMVGLVSALPFGLYLLIYVASVGLAMLLRQRVWQVPILAMFVATFISTILSHLLSLIALRLTGNSFDFLLAFNEITLPSMLLNLLLAIPAYAILADLAKWVYPEELEV